MTLEMIERITLNLKGLLIICITMRWLTVFAVSLIVSAGLVALSNIFASDALHAKAATNMLFAYLYSLTLVDRYILEFL